MQDLRYAWRMAAKQPWFTAAVVGTLAVGIGLNTTVFTLVNGVLFNPLPFPGGDRLVIVQATQPSLGRGSTGVSLADWQDFKKAAGSFERLEAISGMAVTVSEQGNPPERFSGGRISSGLFAMLETPPVAGRAFRDEDSQAGAANVVLLGYGVWKERYGLDPSVIGRSIRANGEPAVVVGVMPEGFKFPSNEDLWMAAKPDEQAGKRGDRAFRMIGKLQAGASKDSAQADLAIVARRLEEQFPDSHKGYGIGVRTFHEAMNGGPIRLVFLLMMGAVGFVLLMACANVANLLLSRAVGREREMAIRLALGASRGQIVRQLLVESVMLSLAGGVLGLGLTLAGVTAFERAVANVGKPYWVTFPLSATVFAYFAVVSVTVGILFGLAPAWQAARANLNRTLQEGAKSSGGVNTGYFSGGLVALQFALAVVLLSGAFLMVRSFRAAQNEFAGITGERILHARVALPESRYATPESRRQFFDKLLPRLRALPGVTGVSMASTAPGGGGAGHRFELAGQPIEEAERRPAVSAIDVGTAYFATVGTPMAQGREFDETDGEQGRETVVVSRKFVAQHFATVNPLGQKMRLYGSDKKAGEWMTIVGVVPEVRMKEPGDSEQDTLIYRPYRTGSNGFMALLVRTEGDPARLTAAVRQEVQQVDELLPLFNVDSLADTMARSRWHLRVFGTVFSIFGLIALGMAAVGIYAVMAHTTGQRTREIGIRLALGASGGRVMGDVMRRGLVQLGIGMTLGLGAAWFAGRLMTRLLFGISPEDPTTYLCVAGVLLLAGLTACWVPARRAARLDPLAALRQD